MTPQPDPRPDAVRAVSRRPRSGVEPPPTVSDVDGRGGGRGSGARPVEHPLVATGSGDGSGSRALTAFDIVVVGAITLLLATLLNADGLAARARRLPVGSPLRSSTMSVTKTLQKVTHALGIDRPADALNKYRGDAGDRAAADPASGAAGGAAPASAAPTTPTSAATGDAPSATDPSVATDPATGDPATSVADVAPGPRVPTVADPAQVYVAGDSLARDLALELVPLVAGTKVAVAQSRVKIGTGLARPDTFNWPTQMADDVASLHPDIVIVEFGGNDSQGLILPGGKPIQHPTDPGWSDEYAKRVAVVMDLLAKDGRKLIWVGAPMARDPAQNAALAIIRQVMVDQTAKHAGVEYVDTWELFRSPTDQYAEYIFVDGDYRAVRQNDGFHLNPTGIKYLAGKVNERVVTELKARGASI